MRHGNVDVLLRAAVILGICGAVSGRILVAQSVTVTSPDGGEVWNVGQSRGRAFQWTQSGTFTSFTIQISRDGGTSWTNVETGLPGNFTYRDWVVAEPTSTACRIKVIGYYAGGSTFDTSNANFTIGKLTITAPNGGENWQAGQTYLITWTSAAVSGNIQVQPYRDNTDLAPITTQAPNTGSYSWAIPSDYPPGSTYQMSISGLSGNVWDFSNANFTISAPPPVPPPPPTLTSPANGSVLADSTPDLFWNFSGNVNYFHVQVDNNGDFSSPEVNEPAIFSANHTPNLADGTYYWRVQSHGVNGLWSGWPSAWSFTVNTVPTGPRLTLTSPVAQQVLLKGFASSICWRAENYGGDITLELYRGGMDVGNRIGTIVTGIPASRGCYSSFVPEATLADGSDYYVRISSPDDQVVDFSDAFSIQTFTPGDHGFSDDFNRPNSVAVGNGWREIENAGNEAQIINNRLSFPDAGAGVAFRPYEGDAGASDITILWRYSQTNAGGTDGVSVMHPGGEGGRNRNVGYGLALLITGNAVTIYDEGNTPGAAPFTFAASTDYSFRWDIYQDFSMKVWVWDSTSQQPPDPLIVVPAFTPMSPATWTNWAIGNRGGASFDDFSVVKLAPDGPSSARADFAIAGFKETTKVLAQSTLDWYNGPGEPLLLSHDLLGLASCVATGAGCLVWAGQIIVWNTFIPWQKRNFERLAADPPDPNFSVVVPVVELIIPVTEGEAGDAALQFLVGMVEQAGLVEAWLTSFERLQGARLADNPYYILLQGYATQHYLESYVRNLRATQELLMGYQAGVESVIAGMTPQARAVLEDFVEHAEQSQVFQILLDHGFETDDTEGVELLLASASAILQGEDYAEEARQSIAELAILFADAEVTSRAAGESIADLVTYLSSFPMLQDRFTGGHAPVANAGADQLIEAGSPDGAAVTLDASGSHDVDGDTLFYEWSWDGGGYGVGVQPVVFLPVGCSSVELAVSDFHGFVSRDYVQVTVVLGDNNEVAFVRGDSNGDGQVDISDVVNILGWLFLGTASLRCEDSGDTNDDGLLDISDGIFLLSALFLGGATVPEPFPGCGADMTRDKLRCRSYSGCVN